MNAYRITTNYHAPGLARCRVIDADGLQAFPKPGTLETLSACQRFVARAIAAGQAREVRA